MEYECLEEIKSRGKFSAWRIMIVSMTDVYLIIYISLLIVFKCSVFKYFLSKVFSAEGKEGVF